MSKIEYPETAEDMRVLAILAALDIAKTLHSIGDLAGANALCVFVKTLEVFAEMKGDQP